MSSDGNHSRTSEPTNVRTKGNKIQKTVNPNNMEKYRQIIRTVIYALDKEKEPKTTRR